MKKYGFMFEDPECGFDVPLIIYIYADNFKEACKKAYNTQVVTDIGER